MWNPASNSIGLRAEQYWAWETNSDPFRYVFRYYGPKGGSKLPLNPFHSEPIPLP